MIDPVPEAVQWTAVWPAVAARLASHRAAGRGHLLTEDTVRLVSVLALEDFGVAPERLRSEVPAPELNGGKLDLVVDPPAGTIIELKYPRDSSTGISPDTMTFGELLRDFLRVASVTASDRWVVQVLNVRLQKYLVGACARNSLRWPSQVGDELVLEAGALGLLPETARRALGQHSQAGRVVAVCRAVAPVDAELCLFAHQVAAIEGIGSAPHREVSADSPPSAPVGYSSSRVTREGARREILAAAQAIVTAKGRNEFTVAEVVEEMHRRGTGYADATIRTMIGAHLCAEATGVGVAGYADVSRTGRGRYRLANWPRWPRTCAGGPGV